MRVWCYSSYISEEQASARSANNKYCYKFNEITGQSPVRALLKLCSSQPV